ncbi:MAG: sarcosine oxidase subunit gamma family protein [Hyphomicrobiales bacterium]|nr:sarcosine oxidase subunit gamma family protein [Hyphomicrobiales bacterium]
MHDLKLSAVSALGASGGPRRFGRDGEPQVRLVERFPCRVWEVAALDARDSAAAAAFSALMGVAPPPPGMSAQANGADILSIGPNRWAIVSSAAIALEGDALALTDLSAARSCFVVSGARAEQVLRKGTSVDLHPSALPEGAVVATRLGHVAVTLWRGDRGEFRMLVARSFARAAWDWLIHAAEEYGGRIDAAAGD